VLILGARGQIGQAFVKACKARRLAHVPLGRQEADLRSPAAIRCAIATHRPWVVVNAGGISRVGDAEAHPGVCHSLICEGAEQLAKVCAEAGLPLAIFSSDQVFDGALGRGYLEADPTTPRSQLGRTHCLAEERVLSAHSQTLVIRTSNLFSWWHTTSGLLQTLKQLRSGREVLVAGDQIISPTFALDLAHATLDLLIDEETGRWHLTNRGSLAHDDFLKRVARGLKLPFERISVVTQAAHNHEMRRPANFSLGSQRGELLPKLDDAIRRFCIEAGPVLAADELACSVALLRTP
jgi:dTDP-4-dehydrorhamnose reductase